MSDEDEVYMQAEAAIEACKKTEEAKTLAVVDRLVTIQLPLTVACEVILSLQVRLTEAEQFMNGYFQGKQLPTGHLRAEIEILRKGIEAFREVLACDSNPNQALVTP